MRIGIDAHALGTGAGGNESYMRALIQALAQHAPHLDLLALVGPDGPSPNTLPPHIRTHSLATRSSYLRVPLDLPWTAWRAQVDLLHVQFNAPPLSPCPYVTSVHDLCWKRFPEFLPVADRYRLAWLMPNTLRRAARIFVLTRAIQQELAEEYRIPADRFDVVQPAVDPRFRPSADAVREAAVRSKYGLPTDYVLYLGAFQPRKNLVRLATAFARLRDQGFPHSLVIVGKRAWLYGAMLEQIEALRLGDRLVFTGYADIGDLPALYAMAAAFAYVSIYEGFGIPVLEALACGAPVLASTDAAIREVAGEAALFCDPMDVEAIEHGLTRILQDYTLRQELRAAGPLRAQQFSPEATAGAAVAGYERALAHV